MNTPNHLSPGQWRHPRDESRRYLDLDYWAELAQTAESGFLDAVFLADVLGVYDVHGGSSAAALRGGIQVPVNDPMQLVPVMAGATKDLGFGITASTSFEHPFPFARRMSTLDHLTKGRIGWNVVTSYLSSGALNLGLEAQEAHGRRYDIAEEYLEVCYKLWETSWDDDALTLDAPGGTYVDPSKVHDIAHHGEFFNVPGMHLSEPSSQRTPYIFQAGASPRGLAFAARHAESVFVAAPSKRVLGRQVRALREAVGSMDRDASGVSILNQQLVIVGETDAQAKAMLDSYLEVADPTGALVLMSGWTGIDFASLDPDEVLAFQESNALSSVVSAFTDADPERVWTVREIAQYAKLGGDGPVIWGSPEKVADELESWVEETGVDGFNLAAAAVPETFDNISHLLVPELQKRGRFKKEYRKGTLREKLGQESARPDPTHAAGLIRASAKSARHG